MFGPTNNDFFEVALQRAIIKNNKNEIEAIPSNEELKETYTFTEQHSKRMKKMFAADSRREVFTIIYKWVKVAGVAFCVSATLVFATLLTSAEVRKAVSSVIVTWFEQFTQFESGEISVDFVERDWSPGYLPEGFVLVDDFEIGKIKGVEYANSTGAVIDFSYSPSDDATSVDNEDKEYSIIVENDIIYHIFESNLADNEYDFNTVIWDMSGYRFTVAGNYDINELIKVALSVK